MSGLAQVEVSGSRYRSRHAFEFREGLQAPRRLEYVEVERLAWAYSFVGERAHAVESLKEDLRLDPKNRHAAQLLHELTTRLP
jgi:hypothetical protein